MQSSTAHNQNVKRKYAKQITDSISSSDDRAPTAIIHQTSHRKCELLSSESDISPIQQIQLRNKLNRNRTNNVHSGYVRRKARWSDAFLGTLLLVLISLVVKLESVIGALPPNNSSVNYYDNASLVVFGDSDIEPFLRDDDELLLTSNRLDERPSSRPSVIYQNEFAVFIPEGVERANQIAEKLGFTNMGQVRRSFLSTTLRVNPDILLTSS